MGIILLWNAVAIVLILTLSEWATEVPFLLQIITEELNPKILIFSLLFPYWPTRLMCILCKFSQRTWFVVVHRQDRRHLIRSQSRVYRPWLRQTKGLGDLAFPFTRQFLLVMIPFHATTTPICTNPVTPQLQQRAGKLMVCFTCVWVSKTTAIQSACNPAAVSGLWMVVIVRLTPTTAIRCLFLSAKTPSYVTHPYMAWLYKVKLKM